MNTYAVAIFNQIYPGGSGLATFAEAWKRAKLVQLLRPKADLWIWCCFNNSRRKVCEIKHPEKAITDTLTSELVYDPIGGGFLERGLNIPVCLDWITLNYDAVTDEQCRLRALVFVPEKKQKNLI